MLDKEGYRPNVGIVLCNENQQVLWARRIRHDGWQFPQGGVKDHETPDDAMFRELSDNTSRLLAGPVTGCIMTCQNPAGAMDNLASGGRSNSGFCCASLVVITMFAWITVIVPNLIIGNG